jgi:hypothetical protein
MPTTPGRIVILVLLALLAIGVLVLQARMIRKTSGKRPGPVTDPHPSQGGRTTAGAASRG